MVPRLVAAAVAQFQTLGPARAVSAPRLNPSKKKRSSRRYLPSSSPMPSDDDEIMVDPVDGNHDMEVDSGDGSDVDALTVLRAIGHAQRGIWSGRWGAVEFEGDDDKSDDEDDDDDKSADDEDDTDENWEGSEEGYDSWEECNDIENPSGLSALDRIGEDFERSAAANSESSCTSRGTT